MKFMTICQSGMEAVLNKITIKMEAGLNNIAREMEISAWMH